MKSCEDAYSKSHQPRTASASRARSDARENATCTLWKEAGCTKVVRPWYSKILSMQYAFVMLLLDTGSD